MEDEIHGYVAVVGVGVGWSGVAADDEDEEQDEVRGDEGPLFFAFGLLCEGSSRMSDHFFVFRHAITLTRANHWASAGPIRQVDQSTDIRRVSCVCDDCPLTLLD